jgi:integrase
MATIGIQKRIRKNFTSYLVSYKDPRTGKKKHYKSYRRLKEAQTAANNLRSWIDNGNVDEIEEKRNNLQFLRFFEVAEARLKDWEIRMSRDEIRKTTFDCYKIWIKTLNNQFGKKLLCRMTKKDLLDFQLKLLNEHSAVTSNRNMFVLKQIFLKGLELNAIRIDMASGIKYLNEREHVRNRFLMPAQIEALVKASQKTRAKFYMPALIYLGTEHGTSRQEALSLRWSDIDFEFDNSGLIKFYRTKNRRERTEFLMPKSRESLLAWREHAAWMRHRKRIVPIDNSYIFCRLDGTPIKRFDTAWRNICKLAGISGFHYHDLRHTFCSSLLMSGSSLKDVKEMIGHHDLQMTDRYSHLTTLHKRKRQTQLAAYYSGSKLSGVDIG